MYKKIIYIKNLNMCGTAVRQPLTDNRSPETGNRLPGTAH